jgi:hypothetical protein
MMDWELIQLKLVIFGPLRRLRISSNQFQDALDLVVIAVMDEDVLDAEDMNVLNVWDFCDSSLSSHHLG